MSTYEERVAVNIMMDVRNAATDWAAGEISAGEALRRIGVYSDVARRRGLITEQPKERREGIDLSGGVLYFASGMEGFDSEIAVFTDCEQRKFGEADEIE